MIPTADQFDLVIIGGGPGGYSAALYAASAGVKAALVEMDALGGTCLNRGCIPAKAFLETAAVYRHVKHSADFGIESSDPSVNFAVTQQRKQKIVAGLVGGVAAMCKGRKVEVFNGWGSLGPDHTVTVTANDRSTTQITGTNVILAAGSVPRLIPGFERGGPIMTSDEVLDLDHVPAPDRGRRTVGRGHGDGLVRTERADAVEHLDLAALAHRGDALDKAVDDALLALLRDREVDGRCAGLDAELGGVLDVAMHGGRLQERLGRDAPPVQARPAQSVHLDHRHLEAG